MHPLTANVKLLPCKRIICHSCVFFLACLNNLISFLWAGFYYSWFMDPCTQSDVHRKMTGKRKDRNKFIFVLLSTKYYYFLQMKNSLLLCSLPLKYPLTPRMFPNYKQNQFSCSLTTLNQHVGPFHWGKKICFWTSQNFSFWSWEMDL